MVRVGIHQRATGAMEMSAGSLRNGCGEGERRCQASCLPSRLCFRIGVRAGAGLGGH